MGETPKDTSDQPRYFILPYAWIRFWFGFTIAWVILTNVGGVGELVSFFLGFLTLVGALAHNEKNPNNMSIYLVEITFGWICASLVAGIITFVFFTSFLPIVTGFLDSLFGAIWVGIKMVVNALMDILQNPWESFKYFIPSEIR